MQSPDEELIAGFVVESTDHLTEAERLLLDIEGGGPDLDVELVNTVFRAVHSTKGAAGFFGLERISALAHEAENVLDGLRKFELTRTTEMIETLLQAIDSLRSMLGDVENSNDTDVSALVESLKQIAATRSGDVAGASETPIEEKPVTANETAASLAPAPEAVAQPAEEIAPSAVPADAAKPALASAPQKPSAHPPAPKDTTVRVGVAILDRLMNLAGELVLGRNQLLQAIESEDRNALQSVGARVNQVTSELQEAIMHSRMQPIGNVFGKFSRIVRDLASQLNKQCELIVEGQEVELDKTIIEAIGDPLTHLIRNALDHGLEVPAVRVQHGKRPSGTVKLTASHQAGRVSISISDDGAGIDSSKLKAKAIAAGIIKPDQAAVMTEREAVRLIFHPGFSMAEKVTDVSGRGVGMDVVRTNIARLGGTVEIETALGQGTTIHVKLPLTLAIIPSLIVHCGQERFAIPQSNIRELVRINANEVAEKIERVKTAEVLRLRGHLLPLVRSEKALEIPAEAMRLSRPEPASVPSANGASGVLPSPLPAEDETHKKAVAINIIVVETGTLQYGLTVDGLHDSEEIVVKPLGRHLKDCPCLAGSTVLGDGRVALILDIASIATHCELTKSTQEEDDEKPETAVTKGQQQQPVLIFTNDPAEQFAVPMAMIKRLERIKSDQIDSVGGQLMLQYRSTSLPLISLEEQIRAKPRLQKMSCYVVVFSHAGMEVGLIVPTLVDICDVTTDIDTVMLREPGVIGSLVHDGKATRLVDLYELASQACPEWSEAAAEHAPEQTPSLVRILVAEDSNFFRKQVVSFLVTEGYEVTQCEDGAIAWNTLSESKEPFDLVVTDIEMPNLNGFDFCRKIKADPRFKSLPVIALTSLAGEDDIKRGSLAGVDEYQVKMDREQLIAGVRRLVQPRPARPADGMQRASSASPPKKHKKAKRRKRSLAR